ncbi:unnamed protein product [Bemisia tabaci]|uniref:Carboxylic ester hydrolase n=1 Tax=Bemisia tabaci TaxID=7038 RepID=A0A9P0ANP2_BEMTA|nr:unnamed protein product [Bemisia tabaci]
MCITMELSSWAKFVLIFAYGALFCRALEVSTPNGKIIGFDTLRTRDGRVIHSFTGIPFAKPPVGSLRFKEPQPPQPWKEPLDATKNTTFCPQVDFADPTRSKIIGQEDCLVLHVYSPKVEKSAKLPVMVFIHGGGFMMGASVIHGPDLLLDKDVVLVTINYRLGPLGFATTGDEAIPANLGLKDQALAIKWVHDNIDNFGGNPDLVTIFGESAGAASVHLNLLSPLNKGLIHRGIAMSGSGYCPWAITPSQTLKDRTKALAVLCSCPPEPSHELLKCMQEVPVELIIEMRSRFQDWAVGDLFFTPTIESETENAFLPKELDKLESEIPFVTGITSGEGGLFASVVYAAGQRYVEELKENPEYVLPIVMILKSAFPRDKLPSVVKKIQGFYFGDKPIDLDSSSEAVINMITDGWFLYGAIEAARKYKGDAYLYLYDYQHAVSMNSVFGIEKVKGVTHSDDLLNLFPLTFYFPERTWTEADVRVSRMTIDMVTDFAKNGKPSIKLEPIKKSAKTQQYLHITAGEPTVKENLYSERVDFWQSLMNVQSEETGSSRRSRDEF